MYSVPTIQIFGVNVREQFLSFGLVIAGQKEVFSQFTILLGASLGL